MGVSSSSYSTNLTNMPLSTAFLKLLPFVSILVPNPRLLMIITSWLAPALRPLSLVDEQHYSPPVPLMDPLFHPSTPFPLLAAHSLPHCLLPRAACAMQPCLHLCPSTWAALLVASMITSDIATFKPLRYQKICRLTLKANS